MESSVIKRYLEIKNGLKEQPSKPIATTKKEKEKVKMDEQYLAGSGGTINQIIEKKPKLKYVVEYLQARVDELNAIELNA